MELVFDCVIPYIQDKDDLNSVSLVSRKYLDIDSLTRKHLTVHVHFAPDPERLSRRFPNLDSLTLKSYSNGFYRGEKCHVTVTSWIQEIAVKFERLKSLSIRNMVVSTSDLKLLAKTRGGSLKSLEIRGCKMFSEDGLVDIARYCIDLRSLRLEYNWIEMDCKPNGKWLHELALSNTVMESLTFHSPFGRYHMNDVSRLAKKCSKSLVSLNIYPRSLSDFRKVFKYAKKLDHFGHGVIHEDWDYSGFEFPPNIRGLRIHELQEASFSFLHRYLNQLRELDLDDGGNCQCSLFERCPNLEVLENDDICGDIGLQVIGRFCKKLRKLNHSGHVTHMGLIALAQGCINLEYLNVTLSDISNEAFECVGMHLKNLRDLRIWLRPEDDITDLPLDKGVRAMLMGCRKLERLDIDLCVGGLTDVGLGYIGEYGHNLRYLSLSYTGESDVGLLELSKGCPKLRELKLRGCPFSEQAIATFVFKFNHTLRYIRVKNDSRDYLLHDDLVLTRPMIQMGESRKEKASEAERSRLDDFTEDNLQEVASSRSDDHTQEVKEEYEGGVESNVCHNEEEVQADIFAMEGSGKHHEDKPGSGRSQCADKSTSVTDESFQDVTQKVLTDLYVTLAEKLHRLAVQLVADKNGAESVKITYTSSRATDNNDTPLVCSMVAKGIRKEEQDILGESFEKPLEIIVRIANVESRFATAVSEFGDIKLQGRVKDGVPRLTKVGAFEADVRLDGHILLCRQVDEPNTVSSVTSILGEENVNISSMSVDRAAPRKQAVMVIAVDEKPSKEALKKIDEISAVEEFVFLAL